MRGGLVPAWAEGRTMENFCQFGRKSGGHWTFIVGQRIGLLLIYRLRPENMSEDMSYLMPAQMSEYVPDHMRHMSLVRHNAGPGPMSAEVTEHISESE